MLGLFVGLSPLSSNFRKTSKCRFFFGGKDYCLCIYVCHVHQCHTVQLFWYFLDDRIYYVNMELIVAISLFGIDIHTSKNSIFSVEYLKSTSIFSWIEFAWNEYYFTHDKDINSYKKHV